MTETPKKTITKEQHLQALALFVMAATHQAKAAEFFKGLANLLGLPRGDDGHFSDAIWGCERWSVEDFEKALARSGITVEVEP